MAESKFEDDGARCYEEKFMDDNESVCDEEDLHSPYPQDKRESKFIDEGDEPEGEEAEETTLAQGTYLFGSDPIVERLVDFWGTALQEDLNTFFKAHCHKFSFAEEHELHYTELHKDYELVVDGHIADFIEEQGITPSELHERLQAATDTCELAQLVLQLVLCCSDFDVFVDIMKQKRRDMEAEEANCHVEISEEKDSY